MDTLTHALSGAVLARCLCARGAAGARPAAGAGPAGGFGAMWRQAGTPQHPAPWQAVWAGALAAAFPDIDAITQLGGDFFYLRHHRGITHSALLAPLWGLLLAVLFARGFGGGRAVPGEGRPRGAWKSFYVISVLGIWLHIAGDWITQFGTMLLAPFSNARFGLGAVFIIDLVLSGILVAALALAAALPRQRWPALLGLGGAVAWVGLCWVGRQEALAAAAAHAKGQGITAQAIEVMPRPASPFNWTLAVFDGREYHVAHVNARRREPLVAGPDDFFVKRFSAPYQPLAQASWVRVPRFGSEGTPAWVSEAWSHPVFATWRWFAMAPALLRAEERVGGGEGGAGGAQGGAQAGAQAGVQAGAQAGAPQAAPSGERLRCAAFRDLRFEFPGREESPFRHGVCLGTAGGATAWRIDGAAWRPL